MDTARLKLEGDSIGTRLNVLRPLNALVAQKLALVAIVAVCTAACGENCHTTQEAIGASANTGMAAQMAMCKFDVLGTPRCVPWFTPCQLC